MNAAAPSRIDFFISRAGADAGAAELIAGIVREAGLAPFHQNEDFGPADFMRRMEQGYQSERTIALLSPEYQQSEYCRAEYNHVLGKDPANLHERLIVLRIVACDPVGSLQNLAYTDLVPVLLDRAALRRVVRAAIGIDQRASALQFWQPLRRAGQQIRHPEIRPFKSFAGRDDLLESLDHKLWQGGGAVAIRNSDQTTVALRGFGGVGKSVLAQEYAWRNRERYQGVWWIRAGGAETLADDLVELGKRLIPGLEHKEPRQAAQTTVDHLAQLRTPKPWLLVYDNVDDPSAIRRLTPADNAHVLITTRRTDWNGEADELPVDVFDRDQAIAFLLLQARHDDRAAAGRLADALDCLPLALSHARAYCWSRNWRFDRYVAKLPEVIDTAPKAAAYPASVFKTFSLAIGNAAQDRPEAETLMGLLAFWAPDQVPLWLIPGDVLAQPALDDAAAVLAAVSLVRLETLPNGDSALSVHRMVQEVMRARLRAAGRFDETAGNAMRATQSNFDGSGSFAAAQRHGYWLSHALAVVVHAPLAGAAARHMLWVWNHIGEIRRLRGESGAALDSFQASLAIADCVVNADPSNAGWQRELSVSHNRIGDVLVAQGNLPAALDRFRASHDIFDRLAKADPGKAGWQRDLSVSHNKIGDVLVAQGNLPAALDSFKASVAIRDRLAKAAPGNADGQRDLGASHDRIGGVLVAQGNLPGALDSFQASHGIFDHLAKADSGNAGWQRDLSVSHNKIGDVLVAQGNLPAALKSFQASLAIRDRLAKADPGNAGWQRDLSVSHSNIGDVLFEQSNLPAALDSFKASLAIADRLAKADPGNAGWQRGLSISHDRIGDVLVEQGNLPAALDSFKASLAIKDRLAKADPGNAGSQRDLAMSNERVGDVHTRQGQTTDAIACYERALGAYRILIGRNPGDIQSRVGSVVPLWRLGEFKAKDGRKDLEEALAVLQLLAEADRLDDKRRGWISAIKADIAALDT